MKGSPISILLRQSPLVQFLIRETTVISLISVNALVLFLDEFPLIHRETEGSLYWIDYGCIIYFVMEALLKIASRGFKKYWSSNWNRFDFLVVCASLPSLMMPIMDVSPFLVFPVLRLGRLFRFIPNIHHIMSGVRRALRASVGIFLALIILNLALSVGATMLFRDLAPQYFGNPLRSAYSLFKVFTVEGWYDIPDAIAGTTHSTLVVSLVRGYFIISVLLGGLVGVSLANAIFVDEMTADNTNKVEWMVNNMHQEMAEMHLKSRQEQQAAWSAIQEELQQVRQMIEEIRYRNGETS